MSVSAMDKVTVSRDVVYGDAGGRPLKLDLYQPDPDRRRSTALIMVHGGGWVGGSKAMLDAHARQLADDGFTVFAPEYRLTGEAVWPAQIHDVKRAIRWVRSKAGDYGFDPDRIALEGHSAGAHLVLLAAGTADDPRFDPADADPSIPAHAAAVIAVYPPVLLYRGATRPSGGNQAAALKGADVSDEAAALASPINHVGADFPPVMLLHGDADKVVPVSASLRFQEALRARGLRVDSHIFAGLPHGFMNQPELRPMLMTLVSGFLRRTVDEPARFVVDVQPRPEATWQ
ncbi:alpha/beta hydrolase fold domain-containing protein [Caulobacter sp. KR2-114]|uniref:alpha/beta hydrolase fold domain-containing protein n=1 Tax=Caulobacter sp. KR2-114 TaxID=3400912 RepID=UPI003C050E70